MKIEKKYDVMTKSQWIEKFLFSYAKMYLKKYGMYIYYATGGDSTFISFHEYPYITIASVGIVKSLLERVKGGEKNNET